LESHVVKHAVGRIGSSDSPNNLSNFRKGLKQPALHPHNSVHAAPHFRQAQDPLQGPFFALIWHLHLMDAMFGAVMVT
jgi:hypothetical protein